MALERGLPVVEINADPTPLTERATVALQGKAGEILPRLIG
jgi:NAD-dependent SIR2 family protein deacetylase